MQFYPLTVQQAERVTENTVTLSFDLPPSLVETFRYKAGQFLTLRVEVNGETLQRAYSLNSSPVDSGPLQITVRAVEGGRVSRWLNDNCQPGDTLDVAPPLGQFCPEIRPDNHRSYFLFAAGSGITPLLSIARTVLTVEPWSHIYLLYGSRDEHNIILREQVEALATNHPERMTLVQTLSQSQSKRWSALWKDIENWQGEVGRIDAERVTQFIQQHPPAAQQARYLICGPTEMINSTHQALKALDVDPADIMVEAFAQTSERTENTGISSQLNIRYAGKQYNLTVQPGENLLETLIREQYDPIYSCQSGVCGACRCQLTGGEVSMANPAALSEQEINQGEILLCQARPVSDQLAIQLD